MQSSGDDLLHHGSWELPAMPDVGAPDSSFLSPLLQQAGRSGASGASGGSFLDRRGLLELNNLEERNAESSNRLVSEPFELCTQHQPAQFKQEEGEERGHRSSAAAPFMQPSARRWNQPTYSISTSRQLSRSVPCSPTFASSKQLHMSSAMIAGAAMAGWARNPSYPMLAKNLSAHTTGSQQASTSASMLTATLDLASCLSDLVPLSPGSIRSTMVNFSSDRIAVAAAPCNITSDHVLSSSSLTADQRLSAPSPASLTTENTARSSNFGTDQASAARLSSFGVDHNITTQSNNFSSELAAAASLFLPFIPTTPASSYTTAAVEQDNHVQPPAASCVPDNPGAKRRRLQGVKNKPFSKILVAEGRVAAGQDALADLLIPRNQSDGCLDNASLMEREMSNNSANNHNNEGGEESGGTKANNTTSSMVHHDCEGTQQVPKPDYIHVRARRGQATDSHSLAERVRREKISERMKFLQDLVPGCNKITGKAIMLDEIINYVQSLQRQVEFLSMKLSTISPKISKFEASHPDVSNHAEPKSIQIGANLHFDHLKDYDHLHHNVHLSMPLLLEMQTQGSQHHKHPSSIVATQAWEDELQSLVQMGFPTPP